MDLLKYKGYEGTTEIDMDRCVCRGKILFVTDLVTYEADAPSELKAAFEAAVDDYLATCRDLGREPQRPLSGQFNVRVSPALHRAASLRAVSDDSTLNDVVCRAIDAYVCGSPGTLHITVREVRNVVSVIDGEVKTETCHVH